MKKIFYPMIAMGLLFLASCSSSDGSDDMVDPMDDDPMSGEVTYEGTIQGIVSNNCLGCHGDPPTNGAPMPLTTYDFVVDAVNNRNLIGRINSATNPMPRSGRMPSSTRTLFDEWVAQGLPEN